jgi:hypothetical protein
VVNSAGDEPLVIRGTVFRLIIRKSIGMDVVILCGGQGARMREETEYRPKPMVEVGA